MDRRKGFVIALALLAAAGAKAGEATPLLSEQYRSSLQEGKAGGSPELARRLAEGCGNTAAVYSVQLWALSNYLYADEKRGLSVPVRIVPTMHKGRLLYRVVSGCFSDQVVAAGVRDVLRGLEKGAHVVDLSRDETALREMAARVKDEGRQALLGRALAPDQLVALFRLYEEGVEREFVWRVLKARPEARTLVLEAAVRFGIAGGAEVVPEKREIGFFLEKAETDAAIYYLEELARRYPEDVYRAARAVKARLREKTYHAILLRCRVAGAMEELYAACQADAKASYLKPPLDARGRNRSLHFQLGLDLLYKRREEFRARLLEDLAGADPALSLYCAEYLGRMGDRTGYSHIVQALDIQAFRLAAIGALGAFGDERDADKLNGFLAASYGPEVNTAAKAALANIRGKAE